MENFWVKTGVAAVISFLTAKGELQHEYILVLFAAMILDYISGIVAGAITGQLSSQKGIKGILKKIGCILVLCVAILVDIFLANLGEEIGFSYDFNCTFSILVVAWLTLNELISILENLAKLGIPLPTFLLKTLKTFENQTEKADVETSKKTKD